MEHQAGKTMQRLIHTPAGSLLVRLVIAAVVLQGLPLWLPTRSHAMPVAVVPVDTQQISRAPAQALACLHDGDVNQNGQVTPADAQLALAHFLGRVVLDDCQQMRANVADFLTSAITPEDVLCIFRRFLGLAACLDNTPPVANAGADQIVVTGTTVQLDGRNSDDADDDALTFHWTLTTRPATSTARLSDAASATPTFVADVIGIYTAQLVVTDGRVASDSVTVQISAVDPDRNAPPLLGAIGNQTVALGDILRLDLTASDVNGDPLTFQVASPPLPANASLNATTGTFTFRPEANQVGDIPLTFVASDGVLTDSETITITVQGAVAGAETALSGRLLDTNDFVLGVETPIVGATIALLGTAVSTTSDANGAFTLQGLPAGGQILDINPTTASLAPDGAPYAGFREEISLIAGVTNRVQRPFFLPRLAMESLTPVNPGAMTVVNNPTLAVSLTVPPNTAVNADGTPFTGDLSISVVPESMAPAALPETLQPAMLITIQPVGVRFDTPVPITFPNLDNLPPGSETDLWSLDPATGTFVIVGTGRVSADGRVIETIAGGIRAADWHMVLPPSVSNDGRDNNFNNQDRTRCCDRRTGSRTSLLMGDLTTDHTLVTYRSMGISRGLRFIYNSLNADPQPILTTNATIVVRAAVPLTVSTRLRVAGIDQGVEIFTDTNGLSESRDETIRQVVQFDASAFETGLYPYRLTTTSNYSASAISSFVDDTLLVHNERHSPFGAGWTLESLQQLRLSLNRSMVLTEGNGSAKVFSAPTPEPAGAVTFLAPPGEFSTLVRQADGTYTRTTPDGMQFMFDANGLQTARVDRNGNITAYTYDTSARLTAITDPVGLATTFVYQDRQVVITDVANRVTAFEHDEAGNLIRITDPDNTSRTFTYDGRHRLRSETNKRGFLTTYTYNFAGRHVQSRLPDASTRHIAPSQLVGLVDPRLGLGSRSNPVPVVRLDDVVATFTDGNGQSSLSRTDRFGAIVETTDPLGRVTTVSRDENGNVTRTEQPNGAVITRTYDDRGNLLSFTNTGIDATVRFSYEPVFNQVVTLTEPEGQVTRNTYDDHGNLTQTVDADGNTITMAYDDGGLVTVITDPASGMTASFSRDEQGNLAVWTNPLGDATTLIYDAAGNPIQQIDAEGQVTRYQYDALNRLTQVTDAEGGVTHYDYDAQGNLVRLVDPRGQERTVQYDAVDRVIAQSNALQQTEQFTYDANDNLLSRTTRDGDAIRLAYDAANQLIRKTLPGNVVTTFAYDVAGNQIASDNPDSRLSRTYDLGNRLTSVSTVGSPQQPETVIQYTYDRNDNRLTMTDFNGGVTTYVYDVLNRPTSITNPDQQTTTFTYDAVSRVTAIGRANGATTDLTYRGIEEVVQITHHAPDGSPIASFTYAYDGAGNRVRQTEPSGERTFTYDTLNRLRSSLSTTPDLLDETFTYDPLGNRLTQSGDEVPSSDLTEDVAQFTYDAENLLRRIDILRGSGPPLRVITYDYDGLGRRIAKHVDGVVIRYVYDGGDVIATFDGENTLLDRYTHGPSFDDPLIMQRHSAGNTTVESFFYHADGLGSVVAMTDTNGAVVQQYAYDAFGAIRAQTGTLSNPYTYTAREFDLESGLYYYRSRYYDPRVGRFLQVDPVIAFGMQPQSLNPYAYVYNRPMTITDPSGAWPTALAGAAIGGLVGGVIGGVTAALTGQSIAAGLASGFVGGAVTGGLIGLGVPPTIAGAAGGAAGQAVSEGIAGTLSTGGSHFRIAAAAGVGALVAAKGSQIPANTRVKEVALETFVASSGAIGIAAVGVVSTAAEAVLAAGRRLIERRDDQIQQQLDGCEPGRRRR